MCGRSTAYSLSQRGAVFLCGTDLWAGSAPLYIGAGYTWCALSSCSARLWWWLWHGEASWRAGIRASSACRQNNARFSFSAVWRAQHQSVFGVPPDTTRALSFWRTGKGHRCALLSLAFMHQLFRDMAVSAAVWRAAGITGLSCPAGGLLALWCSLRVVSRRCSPLISACCAAPD